IVMHHLADRQVLNGDQIKLVDYATTLLVGEISSAPGDAVMNSGHYLTTGFPTSRSMLLFQEAALRVGKSWPFLSEEARVGDLLPGGQSGTRLQAHINTNVLPGLRQTIWLEALARNADLPLACAAALDGSGLGRAFQWPVHDHPHLPHIHDTQPLGLRIQFA